MRDRGEALRRSPRLQGELGAGCVCVCARETVRYGGRGKAVLQEPVEGPHCRVCSGTGPEGETRGRVEGTCRGGEWRWEVGRRRWYCHSQLSSFAEASQAGHGPNPPICASGLLEGSRRGLSHAGKTRRRPFAAGDSCPLDSCPNSGFGNFLPCPAREARKADHLHCRGGTWRRRAGAVLGLFTDSTSAVSARSQNDPESLHSSLRTPPHTLPCVLGCVPSCSGQLLRHPSPWWNGGGGRAGGRRGLRVHPARPPGSRCPRGR